MRHTRSKISKVCLLLAAFLIINGNTKSYAQTALDKSKRDSINAYYDANDKLIHPEFTLEQAKEAVKQRVKHLSLPKMFMPDYGPDTLNMIFAKEPELDWDNYISGGRHGRFVLYEIPIKTDYHLYNKIYYTRRFPGEEGSVITHVALERVKTRSNLLIRYIPKTGNINILVVTVTGSNQSSEHNKDPENAWDYTGNKRYFHGYEIFTDTDGKFLSCFHYDIGSRHNVKLQPFGNPKHYVTMFELPDIGIVSRASNYVFPSEELKSFEKLRTYICPKCNAFLHDGYCRNCNHWEYENIMEAVIIPNSKTIKVSRYSGR